MSGRQWGDERILDYLNEKHQWNGYERNVPYHPRSNKHGALQCVFFLEDLLGVSEDLRRAAEGGEIVYAEDYDIGDPNALGWNVDLVLGPPANGNRGNTEGNGPRMTEGEPIEPYLAIDAKSIMTRHQRARRNRQRDINSFADIMHSHNERTVTGGIVLVNLARRFDSPLTDLDDVTDHGDVERYVDQIIDLFDSIDRAEGDVSANLDEVACVVIRHTNLIEDLGDSELVTDPPAPQAGDRTQYRTFVQRIATTLEDRFLNAK